MENNNYTTYVNYDNNTNSCANTQPSRDAELSFGFGLASAGMILGNQYIGLIFGIIALMYSKKAKNKGIKNKNSKDGRILAMIGTIVNGIFVAFYTLILLFYFIMIFVYLFMFMASF